ncbi:MAG: DUF2194 domain-containing protein [Clostridia bacterium]|nr:DUF2194 domain-containing protein [Clostridia bacterium]
MLKRSEYVVMSLSFVFMLAIFLVISMNYITDSAASNNEITDKFDSSTHIADVNKLEKEYLIIKGDDTVICNNVKKALEYAKKGYKVAGSVNELTSTDFKGIKAVIVTTPNLGSLGDMILLMNSVKNGVNIFFAALPNEGSDNYDNYCEAMGIVSRTGESSIAGFQTFEGLLVQKNDIVCNDYPMVAEDIRIDATCRKYIFEYSPDPNADQSEMVPLLWRTVYGEGQIFVLNADFMEQKYGVGLCIAVMAAMEPDYAYPIVDSKAYFIDSFPFLSYENGDAMMRFYNRDSQAFIKDQVWPNLVTMMKDSDIRFTGIYYAYLTDASRETTNFNTETLSYFKRQFSKYGCEFAFGGYHKDVLSDKEAEEDAMEASYNQFKYNMGNYNLLTYKYSDTINQAVQTDMLRKLRKVSVYISKMDVPEGSSEYQADLSLADHNIVNLPIICEEAVPSYQDYWKACNMASGLGLSTHYFDMYDIITNKSDFSLEWMAYAQNLAKEYNLLNRGTSWLSEKSAAQTGYLAKRYLCLMPTITFTDSELNIKCENFDDSAQFIVKTSKKLKPDDANYEATKISNGFYKVAIFKPEVTIKLYG